jgi:hypothetical protein
MTSSYCLLAYIPFTYRWVINGTLVMWLPAFAKYHTAIYWLALIGVLPTLRGSGNRRAARALVRGFVAFHIIAGAALIAHPLLPGLRNAMASYYWGLLWLVPLVWLGAIDYLCKGGALRASRAASDYPLNIRTFVLSASFLALLQSSVSYLRYGASGLLPLKRSEWTVAIIWELASYCLAFSIGLVVLSLLRSFARRFAAAAAIEFAACNVMMALALGLVVRGLVLPAMSFSDRLASRFAIAFACAVVISFSGLSLRLLESEVSGDGISLAIGPLLMMLPRKGSSKWLPAALVVLVLAAYLLPARLAIFDWDFLLQKLAAITLWVFTFALFYAQGNPPPPNPQWRRRVAGVATASLGFYLALQVSVPLYPTLLGDEGLNAYKAVEQYAGYDVSFKLMHELLSIDRAPTGEASTEASWAEAASRPRTFYTFLQQNTDLKPSVKVSPVDVNLVDSLKPSAAWKPHIFVFVIDSLRQDYLSPYNKLVTFTPNIERLARDSAVMRKAFTRYGGTVLSEPAIWSGSLQLHKQYVEPFHPMNALEKLLRAENYDCLITLDPVLKIILGEGGAFTELDKGKAWFQYDLCASLQELEQEVVTRAPGGRPLFVYTQPQNLHRMALTKNGETVDPGQRYPGFYEHYASQVQRLDECLGAFVEFLKRQRLYDDSVIILTSDHGDSLMEGGRWGHSYWLFPEILRIPLIIHLPARMKGEVVSDADSVAFSTDITPSLYYLLGHRPITDQSVYGRPLFTQSLKEQRAYRRESYLVASSYGPVYGIIGNNGGSLFIADGVNEKDYYFNLTEDPQGTRNQVTPEIRLKGQRLVREKIEEINRFYNFSPQ